MLKKQEEQMPILVNEQGADVSFVQPVRLVSIVEVVHSIRPPLGPVVGDGGPKAHHGTNSSKHLPNRQYRYDTLSHMIKRLSACLLLLRSLPLSAF